MPPKELPLDYAKRNETLAALGFKSYSHYLNSDMWQIIRRQVLDRDNWKCVQCGKPATNVHHNSYDVYVLIGKNLKQLASLCRFHHEQAEFAPDNQKRDLPAVRDHLYEQGVRLHPLIRRPLPACLHEKRFDPLGHLSEKKRERIKARAKREKARRC